MITESNQTVDKLKSTNRPLAPAEQPVDVSIVIPMRNEEPNVRPLCDELQELMDSQNAPYEVIIVNDGSDDQTAHELEKAVHDDPRFTLAGVWNFAHFGPATTKKTYTAKKILQKIRCFVDIHAVVRLA